MGQNLEIVEDSYKRFLAPGSLNHNYHSICIYRPKLEFFRVPRYQLHFLYVHSF
ncbi:hypothetical protein HanIR_Chr09g0390561 [Helianthus annuus]|nr:hypothetical protein HanIR_Chr09g0390561 [Helianthus annuus]